MPLATNHTQRSCIRPVPHVLPNAQFSGPSKAREARLRGSAATPGWPTPQPALAECLNRTSFGSRSVFALNPISSSIARARKRGGVMFAKNYTSHSHPHASGRGRGLGLHHRTSA